MKRWLWCWLGVWLSSCATTPTPAREHEYPDEYTRLEEGACVTFLCAAEACGLYRCEDVESWGRVVPARGASFVLPPSAVRSPQRNWGYVQGLPGDAQPVFIIRWYGRELLPSQKRLLEMAKALATKPREKHHIFPQEFKDWFERQGINIHKETMLIDIDTHHRIHRGFSGGPWNGEWRKFRDNHTGATQEDMYRYAREMIIRFDLVGPILPYHLLVGPSFAY
ncbi:TIGR02269 family lipoprotein [Myxococcus sp. AM011]|uniref:SitA6 family polymorphic toxin lipoprotein n=1 Tax=Myxococcus sp. AM011 TaxID=2745200 RepID=UPI001596040A|nr:TIGR02269 family lipoprotein [Myxococcus sp. AM011]NVJ23209.1 TIGR02269 family lipoprotein [Myxococcus sp. AM011]